MGSKFFAVGCITLLALLVAGSSACRCNIEVEVYERDAEDSGRYTHKATKVIYDPILGESLEFRYRYDSKKRDVSGRSDIEYYEIFQNSADTTKTILDGSCDDTAFWFRFTDAKEESAWLGLSTQYKPNQQNALIEQITAVELLRGDVPPTVITVPYNTIQFRVKARDCVDELDDNAL